ncbi:MAG: Gfo/Idh/MocA family oxidoreductase [bacterium]
MPENNRRSFLKTSALGGAGIAASTFLIQDAGQASANEQINIGVIGLGGRGTALTRGFARHKGARITMLCDPDLRRTENAFNLLKTEHNPDIRREQDFRRVIESRDVDAVVVATPDHWHALPTILACQAGKDVYVEKPCSYCVWEGQKMIEAARKYDRVVQVGTQTRSGEYTRKAKEYITSGRLGKIPLCKIFNLKSGGPFRLGKPAEAPEHLDWDLWLGPAPMREYRAGYERDWYYLWDFCGGDFGNDSIHQIDAARMIIDKEYPRAVQCSGGILAFDDDREVPDTQTATIEFDDMIVSYHNTQYAPYMAKTAMEIRDQDIFPYWYQNSTRVEIYGTEGLMVFGRHGGGWQVFTKEGEVVEEMHGNFPEFEHRQNFLDCIRSRQRPNADIEEGHKSAVWFQLGNIANRLGNRRLEFDAETQTTNDPEANQMLKRSYREPYVIPERV